MDRVAIGSIAALAIATLFLLLRGDQVSVQITRSTQTAGESNVATRGLHAQCLPAQHHLQIHPLIAVEHPQVNRLFDSISQMLHHRPRHFTHAQAGLDRAAQ